MYEDLLEASRLHFPSYLTLTDQHKLFDELKQFPKPFQYYGSAKEESPLQGDGLPGFHYVYRRPGGELEEKAVRGIIISNSCDIAAANDPADDANVLFAPIASLDGYLERYRSSGKSEVQVSALAESIRGQRVTRIFYLPGLADNLTESIVPLDDIRPEPIGSFYSEEKDRIFRLSMYGFWMFLLKLSIHLTRMGEKVRRVAD